MLFPATKQLIPSPISSSLLTLPAQALSSDVCARWLYSHSRPILAQHPPVGVSRSRGVVANLFPASMPYRLLPPLPGQVVGTKEMQSSWCIAFCILVVLVIAHSPARYRHEDSGWNGLQIPADTGVQYWCCPGDLAQDG